MSFGRNLRLIRRTNCMTTAQFIYFFCPQQNDVAHCDNCFLYYCPFAIEINSFICIVPFMLGELDKERGGRRGVGRNEYSVLKVTVTESLGWILIAYLTSKWERGLLLGILNFQKKNTMFIKKTLCCGTIKELKNLEKIYSLNFNSFFF